MDSENAAKWMNLVDSLSQRSIGGITGEDLSAFINLLPISSVTVQKEIRRFGQFGLYSSTLILRDGREVDGESYSVYMGNLKTPLTVPIGDAPLPDQAYYIGEVGFRVETLSVFLEYMHERLLRVQQLIGDYRVHLAAQQGDNELLYEESRIEGLEELYRNTLTAVKQLDASIKHQNPQTDPLPKIRQNFEQGGSYVS